MGHFERIRYPDNQISAKFVHEEDDRVIPLIAERINSYEDLFYIKSIRDIFPHKGLHLFIPCLFGQRSDRKFDEYQSFDLKLITEFINSCMFTSVKIFDPHSDVSMALINNSVKKSSFEYVEKSVRDIQRQTADTDILLVSPDAGAYKKVFEFGEKLGLPVMGAMKHRDSTGKITLMFTHDVEGKDCLIVDDLCDGGYTFELLGKALKEHKARKVYLYVSHGLFSKGFDALRNVIDYIYCTNSVKDINFAPAQLKDPFLTQYKVI